MSLEELKRHIDLSFENAEKGVSKITNGILQMEGMTGKKTRHFYNNLMSRDGVRYLEVGTWRGSSVCSAMCGNSINVVCIDNWSEFFEPQHGGNPKAAFLKNFETYRGKNNASFLEQNCFSVDVSALPKFNTYMYDGNHTYESHYKSLVYFYDCLDETFIFIIDDWNWKHVREATYSAIKDLKLEILYQRQIETSIPDPNGWHNGMFVAVLKKSKPTNSSG